MTRQVTYPVRVGRLRRTMLDQMANQMRLRCSEEIASDIDQECTQVGTYPANPAILRISSAMIAAVGHGDLKLARIA